MPNYPPFCREKGEKKEVNKSGMKRNKQTKNMCIYMVPVYTRLLRAYRQTQWTVVSHSSFFSYYLFVY
jgi:hypothetical protein